MSYVSIKVRHEAQTTLRNLHKIKMQFGARFHQLLLCKYIPGDVTRLRNWLCNGDSSLLIQVYPVVFLSAAVVTEEGYVKNGPRLDLNQGVVTCTPLLIILFVFSYLTGVQPCLKWQHDMNSLSAAEGAEAEKVCFPFLFYHISTVSKNFHNVCI